MEPRASEILAGADDAVFHELDPEPSGGFAESF
jgi:hypothetical protein